MLNQKHSYDGSESHHKYLSMCTSQGKEREHKNYGCKIKLSCSWSGNDYEIGSGPLLTPICPSSLFFFSSIRQIFIDVNEYTKRMKPQANPGL